MNERSRTTNGTHHSLHRSRPAAAAATASAPSAYQPSQLQATAPSSSRDRANLFRSHLTRRPTGSSASAAAAAAALATAQADAARLAAEEEQMQVERCEIVVRDQNGDIDLEGSPAISFDDIDELELEAKQETEHERQRLAEAVQQHRINQPTVPGQPEELLSAVRASLRAKVDALAEDNWMFEPEERSRG